MNIAELEKLQILNTIRIQQRKDKNCEFQLEMPKNLNLSEMEKYEKLEID